MVGLSLKAQSFMYSYTDPCTKELKFIGADMSTPIVISYYGQVKAFSYTELQDGTFDAWLNYTYTNFKTTSPCQGVFTTTTTTTSTNTVMGLVNNVMTLNSLTSLDLSSTTSSLGSSTSVGSTTSSGTGGVSTKSKDEKSNDKSSSNGNNNSTSDAGNTSGSGDKSSGEGSIGSSSEKKEVDPTNPTNPSNSSGSGESGGSSASSSSSSGSSSGSSGSSGSGGKGGNSGATPEKKEEKAPDKVEEQKTEEQKAGGGTSAKAAAKAKVETQKPAILITGDIVGIQTAKSTAQDARATMSFTRVKGDGTSSLGLATDYTVNAKIGNVSILKSWIGQNKKGNKHINVLSGAGGFMPKSFTTSLLFVRVNSLKNFTALYGVSGSYGKLFTEELISTMLIGGFMYKGQLGKHIDATIIAASVYAPYTKYYTESLFKSKPIIVPFLNLNYSMTKTFKFGLTAGGTYIANQDVVNYQILLGGKLKI